MKTKLLSSIILLILFNLIGLQCLTAQDNVLILENNLMKVAFDKEYGRLVSLEYKTTGWHIERRPELAESFRMLVPINERRDNTVFGAEHKLQSYTIDESGKRITFVWNDMRSVAVDKLDIEFTAGVELTNEGLSFTGEIVNNSGLAIDVVFWPYLGDFNVPDKRKKTAWNSFGYSGALQEIPITPKFLSEHGYWGVDYPIQTRRTMHSMFSLIQSENQGLYVAYHDTTELDLLAFTMELKPGFEYAESMSNGTVPLEDTFHGQTVHFSLYCSHFSFINPKEKSKLGEIVIKPYQGDWHAGADLYKTWAAGWKKENKPPEWIMEPHSWQQIHILSPEDRPVFTYRELVDYCEECKENNVKAIQLTGWTVGGQDRGDPSHDTDPKLGTWDDLKNSIKTCEEMGVRIILFNKYTWADHSTEWFKNELINYAVKDRYGDYNFLEGYRYQTATQLQNINLRKLVPLCPLSKDWREIAKKEFAKSIDLGASGMLYDENQHHGGYFYCFDESHGHPVPAALFPGDKMLADDFIEIVKMKKPDYLLAGESMRDFQFNKYHLSYFRIAQNYVPMQRYVMPSEKMMIAVIGYNDRNTINQALMYNYIISYEPRNFKGKLSEYPATVEYGNKVDDLRRKYTDYLWNGEFLDIKGASVKSNNQQYLNYSVFQNRKNGRKAIVIINPGYTDNVAVKVEYSGNKKSLVWISPEEPEEKAFTGEISIKPLSTIIIIEK